jgi:outer membrane protein assembly factor BamB
VVIWRFATGGWIRTAPCIAEDGTIYCVSLDNYLYAIAPNGSMKWRTDVGAGTSPTIGQDGTIYAGWSQLYAINPLNGHVKWVFNPGPDRVIEGGTPAHSADGTIYFGVCIGEDQGGEIIAINSNGNEEWRATIADERIESAPAISEDGTIYIGSSWKPSGGFLHAFGPKNIKIEKPEPGKLYLFGVSVCKTLLGKTIIIGSVTVKVNAESWNEIESIHFYFDGIDQYNLTKPPFEWRMNKRDEDLFPLNHTIMITGYYQDGSSYSDSIDVLYFHF